MIRAAMVINTLGKPRLSRFYDFQPVEKQHQVMRHVYAAMFYFRFISQVLCFSLVGFVIILPIGFVFSVFANRPENVSNFVEVQSIFGVGTRLVYKHYATLYFVIVYDNSENELAMLDLIQVFVETLDKYFRNVCELDMLFNYNKIQTILDEIIFGGQVLETDAGEVIKAAEEISKLETFPRSSSLVARSITAWRGR